MFLKRKERLDRAALTAASLPQTPGAIAQAGSQGQRQKTGGRGREPRSGKGATGAKATRKGKSKGGQRAGEALISFQK
jgi:hypothetical protein